MDKVTEKTKAMKSGGKLAASLRTQLVSNIRAGISTADLEEIAKDFFVENNLTPSFLGYDGYPYSIVVCINEEVVHGLPSSRVLEEGDIVTVDMGVLHDGYHTDTAVSVEVGTEKEKEFLVAGKEALENAVKQCKKGNHVGDISAAIQERVEKDGYSVIRAFVGHGVGKKLHEAPDIPCFGEPGTGALLEDNMTLAVEVMYTKGSFQLQIQDDGWTVVARDGALSAMFEHTVLISGQKPLILTA